jgi:predicted NUDIX family NTP pyrophosphohydrolase
VLGWALQGDLDPPTAESNTYDMEWPLQSGVVQTFPEIDRVEWFDLDEARRRLKAAQVPFPDRLQAAPCTRPPITDPQHRKIDSASRISRTVRP